MQKFRSLQNFNFWVPLPKGRALEARPKQRRLGRATSFCRSLFNALRALVKLNFDFVCVVQAKKIEKVEFGHKLENPMIRLKSQ